MKILLVDDDSTDRELFIEAAKRSNVTCNLDEAANGEEALETLQQMSLLPDLIVLDLNMPIMDGRETLKKLKTDQRLRSIPVCIMSTSSAHFDVDNVYNLGAGLFIEKPADFKQLTSMLNSLLGLFHQYVKLPNRAFA